MELQNSNNSNTNTITEEHNVRPVLVCLPSEFRLCCSPEIWSNQDMELYLHKICFKRPYCRISKVQVLILAWAFLCIHTLVNLCVCAGSTKPLYISTKLLVLVTMYNDNRAFLCVVWLDTLKVGVSHTLLAKTWEPIRLCNLTSYCRLHLQRIEVDWEFTQNYQMPLILTALLHIAW